MFIFTWPDDVICNVFIPCFDKVRSENSTLNFASYNMIASLA